MVPPIGCGSRLPYRRPILSGPSSPQHDPRHHFRIRSVTLRLHDARRGGLLRFAPIPGRDRIGLYVCGVTPYDTGHLGHAFTYVGFDVLHRYLEYLGHDVVYVQNLTDVDDDMLRGPARPVRTTSPSGNRNVTTFLTEMAALNWLPPDRFPRATRAHPADAGADRTAAGERARLRRRGQRLLQRLRRPSYGELSHLSRDEMLPLANERGNVPDMPGKRDPLDFVLWQRSLPDEPPWDVALGSRAARLAHRVLRHVDGLPREPVRDPRRRRRPGLPAPRVGDAPSPRAPPGSARSSSCGCTPGCSTTTARR